MSIEQCKNSVGNSQMMELTVNLSNLSTNSNDCTPRRKLSLCSNNSTPNGSVCSHQQMSAGDGLHFNRSNVGTEDSPFMQYRPDQRKPQLSNARLKTKDFDSDYKARYQHLDSTPPMMPNKVIDLEVTPPDSTQKHIRRPNPLDYILKSVNGRSSDFLQRRSFQAVQNSECSPVPVSPMEVDSSAVLHFDSKLLKSGNFMASPEVFIETKDREEVDQQYFSSQSVHLDRVTSTPSDPSSIPNCKILKISPCSQNLTPEGCRSTAKSVQSSSAGIVSETTRRNLFCASTESPLQMPNLMQNSASALEPMSTSNAEVLKMLGSAIDDNLDDLAEDEVEPLDFGWVEGHSNLIGDFTKPFCLPLVQGKHPDLKAISPDTLAEIMSGDFDEVLDSWRLVDCRYPYEYINGHLLGAKNIFHPEELIKEFFPDAVEPSSVESIKRTIAIFHCEFSSERAPKMIRLLRNLDRDRHQFEYPSLQYPEVYVLEGGYKAFFESHPELCVPQQYTPMLHPDHADDLKHFQALTRSYEEEQVRIQLKKQYSNLKNCQPVMTATQQMLDSFGYANK